MARLPAYGRHAERADAALYLAKANGRNQIIEAANRPAAAAARK